MMFATADRCCLSPPPLQVKLLAPQEVIFAQQKGTPIIDVRPEADYEKVSEAPLLPAGPASAMAVSLTCKLAAS